MVLLDIGIWYLSFRIYKNQPLSEILTELEEPYKIKFSYLDQLIENKQITTSFSRQPLSQALKLILQGTNLAFQIVDFMLPGKHTATSTHTEH